MLADLVAATDPSLSELARRLAGRIFIEVSSRVGPTRRGVGRVVSQRSSDSSGDLDLDASADALVRHRATGVLEIDELRHRVWTKNTHAISLVIDRSGSMGGAPLATAALAAAAVAHRKPIDYSILVFGGAVGVANDSDEARAFSQRVGARFATVGGPSDIPEALLAVLN